MVQMEKISTKNIGIVFFGTPDFASYQLKYLHDAGYNIKAVVTTPDRPQGRGKKLKACAVKEQAMELNLPILEPNNLKSPEFIEELKSYNAELQIIVAFRMLPEAVWSLPKYGTINLHGSYLPNYRGAAPINWAIINDEAYTGVSTFILKHEIDTGAVLLRKKVTIEPEDTFGTMYEKLMIEGAPLIVDSIEQYLNNEITPKDQASLEKEGFISQKAPKLDSSTGQIDWNLPSKQVFKLIKGLSPHPSAYTFVQNEQGKTLKLKIIDAELSESKSKKTVGKIEIENKNSIRIQCSDSALYIKSLQLEGKKAMNAKDFLNGVRFDAYQIVI